MRGERVGGGAVSPVARGERVGRGRPERLITGMCGTSRVESGYRVGGAG